jgi:uncharacterized phage protein gp47/JayE
MPYGVTPEGFSQKELDDIKTEIEDELRAAFGPETNLLASSAFGQITGVFSDKLAELWEVAAGVYRSMYPDSASDEALDNVAAITGTEREAASQSLATLDNLYLDPGTTLDAGRIVSVGELGNRFVTRTAVTNVGADPAIFSVLADSENTGPVTGYSGTIDTIVTPVAGWAATAAIIAGSTQPFNLVGGETLDVKVDSGTTQIVNFLAGDFGTPGAATAAEVAARISADLIGAAATAYSGAVHLVSDLDGSGSAIQVTGGTANLILDFATDLVKGFNSEDAILGADEESDPELRISREQELEILGQNYVTAIRSAVSAVDGVNEVFVYNNPSDVTDPDGIPPHSFETVLRGPAATDAELAEAIFSRTPAGIEAYGTTVEPVLDEQGFTQDIGFSRATEVDIYVEIDVTVNTSPGSGPVYPLDGDDQVKAAIATLGNSLGIGQDVIAERIKCAAFEVSGVVDVTVFKIDTITPPVATGNITIQSRQISVFDTGDITVNS